MNTQVRPGPGIRGHTRRRRLLVALLPVIAGGALLLATLHTTASASARSTDAKTTMATGFLAAPGAPSTESVQVTKTIHPPNPIPGQTADICFTITGVERRQLDTTIVQDVSGSMKDPIQSGETLTGLQASRIAARAFISQMLEGDQVAILSYSDDADLVQPLTPLKSEALQALDGLEVMNYTNVGAGIALGHQELITSPRQIPDAVKAMILLSDGQANRPFPDSKQYARDKATAAAGDGVTIYTIGFGEDADEQLLQDIADIGQGAYYFAPDAGVLQTVYLSIALNLHNLTVTDVLTPGAETECTTWPPGLCVQDGYGPTTVTLAISSGQMMADPIVACFPVTVNLPFGYEGALNGEAEACYDEAEGGTSCTPPIPAPRVWVGARLYLPTVLRNHPPLIVTNGGFESGWIGWRHGGQLNRSISPGNSHSGSQAALLGDPGYDCAGGVPLGSAWMEQTVEVPASGSPELTLWYNLFSHDKNTALDETYDTFDVKIDGGLVLRDANTSNPYGCDNLRNLGWRQATVDLGDYRGTTITIRFETWNRYDGWYNTWVYVDDVTVRR